MMRKTRFRVLARLEMASVLQEATVTIDRETGTVQVRPLRRRRQYLMSLADVASWIVRTNIRAEVAEKKRAKKKGRR